MPPKASNRAYWAQAPPQELTVQCEWKGHFHVHVGVTPAIIALLFVGCLVGCYRKNQQHLRSVKAMREMRNAEEGRKPSRRPPQMLKA